MSENSKIEWCDHTFNPWIGCTKVSPGCDHCYAEAFAKRFQKDVWGKGKPRERTSEANWKKPLKWDRDSEWTGVRPRVFCASLADWLDPEVPVEWLADLLNMIRQTPLLNWLLLTKRPEKWFMRIDDVIKSLNGPKDKNWDSLRMLIEWSEGLPPHNVWIGTTVENQAQADKRIPKLLEIPARVRFLSCEPLLGPIKFADVPGFNRISEIDDIRRMWVICGGESGPGARPMHPDWARGLRDQCQAAGVPFLFKQWGEWWPCGKRIVENKEMALMGSEAFYRLGKKDAGRLLDGREWNEFPKGGEIRRDGRDGQSGQGGDNAETLRTDRQGGSEQ